MPFNLFHKKKEQEPEVSAEPSQETPQQAVSDQPEPATVEEPLAAAEEKQPQETPSEPQAPQQEESSNEQPVTPPVEEKQEVKAEKEGSKTYLKAMPLKELSDVEKVKAEVKEGNIIILRITPLATKSIEDVKTAVNDLFQFAEETGGDIARLGEERVVVCPKSVRIWREKTPAPVKSGSEPLPTAA
ncbi:MAG: cell division protein SepF [Candidatus Bathyarchaeia archaeon]|jgi:SepF-like predicted cell division protein (DUF552 family)